MTPIKLADFLPHEPRDTSTVATLNLIDLGLFHAAPFENGRRLLAMRFDQATGTLTPAA